MSRNNMNMTEPFCSDIGEGFGVVPVCVSMGHLRGYGGESLSVYPLASSMHGMTFWVNGLFRLFAAV